MKILFLNGPPRSGKDTIGRELAERSPNVDTAKFAAELKDATHRAFNLQVPTDHFEDRKDQPCPEFFGQTPRNCYIAMSERFFKPLFGQDIFGRMLVKTLEGMERAGIRLVAITDSGFSEEAEAVLKSYPDALLMRLHRDGTSFMGDSRSYIQLGILTADAYNNQQRSPLDIADQCLKLLGLPLEEI